jgi:hypothetical protein
MSRGRRAPSRLYGTDHNGYYKVEDCNIDEGVSDSGQFHNMKISDCDTAGQLAM